jgi:hypothetical protein
MNMQLTFHAVVDVDTGLFFGNKPSFYPSHYYHGIFWATRGRVKIPSFKNPFVDDLSKITLCRSFSLATEIAIELNDDYDQTLADIDAAIDDEYNILDISTGERTAVNNIIYMYKTAQDTITKSRPRSIKAVTLSAPCSIIP